MRWDGAGSRPVAAARRTTKAGEAVDTPVGSRSGPAGGRIVLVTNGNSDWWSAVEKGMKDAGTEVLRRRRDEAERRGGGTEGQIRLLEEALGASDVKGVAVSAVEADAPGIADAMKKLKDAGKFVITIDSDVAPSAAEMRRFYIGTDNAKAGEIAGKATAHAPAPGGHGRRVRRDRHGRQRAVAAGRVLRGAPARSSSSRPSRSSKTRHDMNKAQSLPEVAITKHPDAGVMLGLYSYNAPRIAAEVAKVPEFRKKATIVTFDLDEQAVAHLEKGDIDVSVCQNPYEIGYQSVRCSRP